MKFAQFVLMLVAITLVPSMAWSATTTLTASKDNTIYQSSNSVSAGGAAGIYSGTNSTGSIRRGLIAFDIVGSIPSGSTITNAQLTLYLGTTSNNNSVTIGLHKLNKDWGEGTAGSTNLSVNGGGMGFAASTGDATWSHAKLGTDTWTNPGATGDFNPTASATAAVTGPAETSYTWNSTANFVADVQSWLDTPASNFGWTIINASEATANSTKTFYSRQATQNSTNTPNSLDLSWRPALTITYVPEPSTCALFLLAAPWVFVLRRR